MISMSVPTSVPPVPADRPLPLAGVRVIEIASLYAAPLAGTLLADFGAEVIKVEPPEGDGFRGTGMWPLVGRNKQSVTLDIRQPEGCELLKQLVERSDVLVENYPPAVLARRGIGWADLRSRNSDLVMLSLSCFGLDGPNADQPGNGTLGEAFGGMTHLMGLADGPPTLPSFALGDALGAMGAVIGTMMALYWRDGGRARSQPGQRNGRGQQVDATLYEPVLFAISQAMARWQPGRAPTRSGSRLPGSAVRNVYATRDGRHVAISASTERHLQVLVGLGGVAAGDAQLDADAVVARWVAAHPLDEVLAHLVAERVPVAPIQDIEHLLANPHILARGNLLRVDDPELGPLSLVQPAPKLGATPGSIRSVGPKLAEHNDAVWGGLMGLGAEQQAALRARRVI